MERSANVAEQLAQLDKQRSALQISEWEYETAKQQLIDPTAQGRSILKRNLMAIFIVIGVAGTGMAGFAVAYPIEAKFTAEFAWDVVKYRRKTVFERFQEFEDSTESVVDGWFEPDQTAVQ
jgi:hypothetical protein